jgi:hypothetical protein
MKFKTVTIERFRGVPATLELRLDGKSVCVLGENGTGKTSIVDALEFWSTGDLDAYHRERCGIDAAVNIDSTDPAVVTCHTNGSGPAFKRRLSGDDVSDLEVVGPSAVGTPVPPRLPILRHRTMAEFMNETAGAKQRILLDLLGLSPLLAFRDALVTAHNSLSTKAETAARSHSQENAAVIAECGAQSPIDYAESLRKAAGIEQAIASERDLLSLAINVAPVPSEPNRPKMVAELARALEGLTQDPIEYWNELVGDRRAQADLAVEELVKAGTKVLGEWPDESCPLCERPTQKGDLRDSLARRASDLAQLASRFRNCKGEMNAHRVRVERVVNALREVQAAAPQHGWPSADALDQARISLEDHGVAVRGAYENDADCERIPVLDEVRAAMPAMTRSAAEPGSDPRAAAIARLATFHDKFKRLRRASSAMEVAQKAADNVGTLRNLAEEEIRGAVIASIRDLAELTASYYSRLVSGKTYSDVTLTYREERSGGIEFSLCFDSRHTVTPPQRVVSESQLNALGLALFLARMKREGTPWDAFVLDDVVNSFDANHRLGLARLLSEEFAESQVILFTHDSAFFDIAQRMFHGWRFKEVVAWSPSGGPVLGDGDLRARLVDRLGSGQSAGVLGGIARIALEQSLSRPLEKLALPIRHDPHGRHSAQELLIALRRGLKDRGSALRDLPVLKRMAADTYLTNLGAHDRPTDPALSRDDLWRLAEDLKELEDGFICDSCSEPVWKARTSPDHCQCGCSKLAV